MKFLKNIIVFSILLFNVFNNGIEVTKHQFFKNLSTEIISGSTNVENFVDVSIPETLDESLKNIDWIEIKKLYANDSNAETMRKFLRVRFLTMIKVLKLSLENEKYFPCTELKDYNNFKGTAELFVSKCVKVRQSDNLYSEGFFKFSMGGSVTLTSDIDLSVDFNMLTPNYYNSLKNVSSFISRFNKIFKENYNTSPGNAFDLNLYSSNFANEEIIEIIANMSENNKDFFSYFINTNRLSSLMILYNDAFKVFKEYTKSKLEINSDSFLLDIYKKTFIKSGENIEGSCGLGLLKSDSNLSVIHTKGFLEKLQSNLKNVRETDDIKRLSSMEHFIREAGLTESQHGRPIKKRNLYVLCSLLTANFYAPEAYIPFSSIFEMLTLQGVLEVEKLKTENQKFVIEMTDEMWLDSFFMNFAYAVEHSFHHSYQSDKFSKYVSRIYRIVNKLPHSNQSINELKKCVLSSFENNIKFEVKQASKPSEVDCNNRSYIYLVDLLVKNENKENRTKCQCEMKVLRNFLTQTSETKAIKFTEETYNCSNIFLEKSMSSNSIKKFKKMKKLK